MKNEKSEIRDGFKFRAGHVALDLPATMAARLKPLPLELLGHPSDLGRWLRAAGKPYGKASTVWLWHAFMEKTYPMRRAAA
jgi:hypothetical protein